MTGSSTQEGISVGDLLKLIKGFVDMLILASGYQSSGLPAHWDSSNIKKAFKWALFFENVFSHLKGSDNFLDFMKELEAALSEMTSHPSFPQGLTCLSSSTLVRARTLLAECMVHALPLTDEHLKALMIATTEMDLDELHGGRDDSLNVYLDRLMLLSSSFSVLPGISVSMNDSTNLSPQSAEDVEIKSCNFSNHTKLTVQELLKRQSAVSCLLTAEKGLDILAESAGCNDQTEHNHGFYGDHLDQATVTLCGEQKVDYVVWTNWRSRNLSYFLDKRTIKLVSGASMIFSTPKVQWIHVFKQLIISSQTNEDVFLEAIEIMLLGCISSQWDSTIQHFMIFSYDFPTISKQYQEICNLFHGRSRSPQLEVETVNPREKDIVEYLTELLGRQVNQLWKLPPAIVAAAIPSWSPLFRLYLTEIEAQFKGEYSTIRHCNCVEDQKDHIDCEVAERIWCLYIFHVRGSNIVGR
ncbi:hypothetical protein Ancab_019732 [Ancistrocladus abbreviatus]